MSYNRGLPDHNFSLGLVHLLITIVIVGLVALGALVMFTSVFV